MITIAKMIREDKNVSKDDLLVQEEMTKVMELETEIANVSTEIKKFSGCLRWGEAEVSHCILQQLDTAQNSWPRGKEGGKRLCAVISPETRASACIITSIVDTATLPALTLTILIFGSLLKQDNLCSAELQ